MSATNEHLSSISSGNIEARQDADDDAPGSLFGLKYPLRILVAEDNYVNRRIFVMYLKRLGYHADSVEDGLDCLSMALQGTYDLIMTDIDIPGMNGIECARHLRQAGIDTRIVAVSGSSILNAREECLKAGMDDYLAKPFPPHEVRRVLRETSLAKTEKPHASP